MAVGLLLAIVIAILAKFWNKDTWILKSFMGVIKLTYVFLIFVGFQAPKRATAVVLFPEENTESYRLLHKTQKLFKRVQDDDPYGDFWNECKLRSPNNLPITFFSEGFGRTWTYAPSTGFLKAGMFFVDFPNAQGSESPNSLYRAIMPDADIWYNTSSYGRLHLNLRVDISKFYRMPFNSSMYGWNSRSLTGQMQAKYITDALLAFGSKPEWGDLEVLYIVPTRAAREIWFSPTFMGPMRMGSGNLAMRTVTFGQDMWTSWGFKVLNHETAHTMGLPDLYPLDAFGLSTTIYSGGWDIMGLISGTAPDLFAWHKWKLNWIDDNQVNCVTRSGVTRHVLTPLELDGGTKMITVKLNDTSALAIELRSKQGIDRDTCSQGLLFYVVHVDRASGFGPIQVINPRKIATVGCSPTRGGPLTSAAIDFTRGETQVNLPQYGITVQVEAKQGPNYWVWVNYDERNQWIFGGY